MQRLGRLMLRFFWLVLMLAAVALSMGPVAGLLADRNWQCELATHFQVHYVVLLGIIALIFALDGRFRWATYAMTVAIAAFCYHLLPLYIGPTIPTGQSRTLRLVSANLAFFNPDRDRFIRFVQTENPDVVLLFELTREWSDALAPLHAAYPHRQELAQPGHEGIAVLSKLEFADIRIDTIGQKPSNVIVGTLKLSDAKRLSLIGTHPDPPITWGSTLRRNDQVGELAGLVTSLPQPLVVAGDLNTSSWNPAFKQLIFATGLRDSRLGFGVQPTWNMNFPVVRTPIDHCLVSGQVQVLTRRVGPNIGSDHLPVIVDLYVP